MNCIAYIFSGTGNTAKTTKKIAEILLKEHGVKTDFYRVEENAENIPDPNCYDRALIAYPVHGFNAPEPILKLAKALPECRGGKSLYIVKTSGEPLKLNSASSCKLASILRKTGYGVAGEYHLVMPYNIIFRHSDAMASKMWNAVEKVAPSVAAAIADGKTAPFKPKKAYKLVSDVVAVEQPAMKLIGRGFKADAEKCVACGICVKNCPQNNITVENGVPAFGKNCIGCMRCSFRCPSDAISIGILNKWKVNGAYKFDADFSEEDMCGYCRRSYEKYFEKADAVAKSENQC